MKRMVKCPECDGKGTYEIEQHFQGKTYLTPVTCSACGGEGKITWKHFCTVHRRRGLAQQGQKG
jgi:DnaJ-class molecular chaperone